MEKLTVKSYIEKRIQKAVLVSYSNLPLPGVNYWGNNKAEAATFEARMGYPGYTASYLQLVDTLSIDQKGKILAEAYAKRAERLDRRVTGFASPIILKIYQGEAQKANKIAQGLTRAAQRLQTS